MPENAPKIDAYNFGEIVIDGQTYTEDVIIFPDRVLANWWRKEGHVVHVDDLKAILESDTVYDTLIVGLGAQGEMRIAQDARQAIENAGIELISESTDLACESYNALRVSGRVVAALHLTC